MVNHQHPEFFARRTTMWVASSSSVKDLLGVIVIFGCANTHLHIFVNDYTSLFFTGLQLCIIYCMFHCSIFTTLNIYKIYCI